MSQYFTLFQLEPAFDIDAESLEQTYRALAARFHPDKFASSSAFEQKQAVMMSSTINDAYRTLRNPIDRAAYLLKTLGIDADAPEHTSFAPEFLMQQMEWRETLMDAQMAQTTKPCARWTKKSAASKTSCIKICGRPLQRKTTKLPLNGCATAGF